MSRLPLIRAGEGPLAALTRQYQQRIDHERKLADIILASEQNVEPDPKRKPSSYGIGDVEYLRGLPAVGVIGGLGGAMRGSRPTDCLRKIV